MRPSPKLQTSTTFERNILSSSTSINLKLLDTVRDLWVCYRMKKKDNSAQIAPIEHDPLRLQYVFSTAFNCVHELQLLSHGHRVSPLGYLILIQLSYSRVARQWVFISSESQQAKMAHNLFVLKRGKWLDVDN